MSPVEIEAGTTDASKRTREPGYGRQGTLVERVLSPIADVRQEEAASALLMTLLMFLILAAYYELKTAREVFILSQGGAEVKSYSSAGQALLLLGLVPAYGAFASKVNRERLVTWVTLFFVSNVLLFCTMLARVLSRVARRASPREVTAAAEKPLGKEGGFELIRKDRYLLLIAVLTVLLNVVNTSGEYLFGRYVVDQANAIQGSGAELAAARERFIGETYSHLFSTVNLVGFLLQMFVVSRVFKYLGVGKALFIHPLVAGVGYLLMLRAPSIQLMTWLKVADNSIDYSLGNTTKQALWLPTSREAKYKAKQAVDSFFMRAGDVLQAAVVFTGERLAFTVPAFAAVNVVLVGGWLAVAGLLRLSLRRKAEKARTAEL